jgi:hypothetical protein
MERDPKKFIENSKEIYQFSGYTVFAKATFKGKDDYQKQRRHSEAKKTFRAQRRHSKAKTTFKTILKALV